MAENQFNKDFDEVKRDGMALQYVKEQSPEICMEAVKQNGRALQYVKEQTPEICLEAVKQDVGTLIYVQPQFRDEASRNVKMNERRGKLKKDIKAQIGIKNLQVALLEVQLRFPEGYLGEFAFMMKENLIRRGLLAKTARGDEKVDRIIKDFGREIEKVINPTCEEVNEQWVKMFLKLGIDKDKIIEKVSWAKEYLQ